MLAGSTASYVIATDMQAFVNKHRYRVLQEPLPGQIVFSPDDYKWQQEHFKVKDYRLSEEGCQEYARIATQVRLALTNRAKYLALAEGSSDPADVEPNEFVPLKLNRRYERSKKPPCQPTVQRPDLVPSRGKPLAKFQLSSAQIQ